MRLTPRELEVARLVAQGLTNNVIAASLGISYETVKEHVQKCLKKLDFTNRVELAIYFVRREKNANELSASCRREIEQVRVTCARALQAMEQLTAGLDQFDMLAETTQGSLVEA